MYDQVNYDSEFNQSVGFTIKTNNFQNIVCVLGLFCDCEKRMMYCYIFHYLLDGILYIMFSYRNHRTR